MGPLSRLTRLQQITLISLSDCHHRLGDALDSRLLTTGRALHKKSWAVIDRPYSLGCATVGALYERPRCIFCAKPRGGEDAPSEAKAQTGWREARARERSFNRRSATRFGRTDHPGASRHPSSARRGIAVRRLS